MLLHLLSMDPAEDEDPLVRYRTIREEPVLLTQSTERLEIVVLTKCDLLFSEEELSRVEETKKVLRQYHKEHDISPHIVEISAAARTGLEELKAIIWDSLKGLQESTERQIKEELKEKGVAFLLERPPHEDSSTASEATDGTPGASS